MGSVHSKSLSNKPPLQLQHSNSLVKHKFLLPSHTSNHPTHSRDTLSKAMSSKDILCSRALFICPPFLKGIQLMLTKGHTQHLLHNHTWSYLSRVQVETLSLHHNRYKEAAVFLLTLLVALSRCSIHLSTIGFVKK